jgi:signal transduction histidine kinase
MTQTYHLSSGRPGVFGTIARTAFLAVAAVGGLFMLVFSAAFALFAVAAIAALGFIVFAFFWARAKLTGKPFGPRAQFEAQMQSMRADMESQMGGHGMADEADGPVVDAHRTPDGWSVDD